MTGGGGAWEGGRTAGDTLGFVPHGAVATAPETSGTVTAKLKLIHPFQPATELASWKKKVATVETDRSYRRWQQLKQTDLT